MSDFGNVLKMPNVTELLNLLPPGVFDELKAKHGDIIAVKTKAGVFAFRTAKRGEYARFNDMLYNEKQRSKASEFLIRTCVVYPGNEQVSSVAALDAAIDRYPGIIVTCSNPLVEACGLDTEAEVGKGD